MDDSNHCEIAIDNLTSSGSRGAKGATPAACKK